MFVHYRTQGIILKKVDREESNQLFTIYTKDFGRLEVLGRAIRKISSKLRSAMEIFYLSEVEFIQGKGHKTLTDAILIEKFPNLRNNLKRLKVSLVISEILDNLILDQEPDGKIWQLLRETLEKLNTSQLSIVKCQMLYYYFLWNFLSILGYRPELYRCVICQKKLLPEKLYFGAKEGGIICQSCQKRIKLTKEIEIETVKILRILLERDWSILNQLKIEAKNLNSLKIISHYFLSEITQNLKRQSI